MTKANGSENTTIIAIWRRQPTAVTPLRASSIGNAPNTICA
jgi:hypothetical protein